MGDVGHLLATPLYHRFTRLSPNMIRAINLFYGVVCGIVLPMLVVHKLAFDTKHLENFLLGLLLRCVTGTLTQMPCPEGNEKYFSPGELGGFGPHRSMIWIFSGHCFTMSCAQIVLCELGWTFAAILWAYIHLSLIIWYLGTKAHYSIDML